LLLLLVLCFEVCLGRQREQAADAGLVIAHQLAYHLQGQQHHQHQQKHNAEAPVAASKRPAGTTCNMRHWRLWRLQHSSG
jgi:hypothetical protein